MLGVLISLFMFGLVGLVVMSLVMALIGIFLSVTFGLVGVLLFKVAPLLLIGWAVLKLMERSRSRREISAADRRWLDG